MIILTTEGDIFLTIFVISFCKLTTLVIFSVFVVSCVTTFGSGLSQIKSHQYFIINPAQIVHENKEQIIIIILKNV